MSFEFEWDPVKAASNAAKHDVSFHEASTVFADPLSSTFPDPEHSLGEERFVIFGVSHRGRVLAVMYSERRRLGDKAEVIRLISAREATRSERTAYEEGTR
jgi:uncharacterized DUF497 family protein